MKKIGYSKLSLILKCIGLIVVSGIALSRPSAIRLANYYGAALIDGGFILVCLLLAFFAFGIGHTMSYDEDNIYTYFLGIGMKKIRLNDIASLEITSTYNGWGMKFFYLRVKLQDGRKHKINITTYTRSNITEMENLISEKYENVNVVSTV